MKATEARPWLRYHSPDGLMKKYEESTVVEYLLRRNKDRMDINALSYFDRDISFRELIGHIYETANSFASLGVGENDVVAVCSVATPEIVYTFYGLSLLGAASNMLDPRYSVEGLRAAIKEEKAKVVVTLDVVCEKIIEAVRGTDVKKVIVVSPAESMPAIKRKLYLLKNPMKKGMPERFCHWGRFIAEGREHKTAYLTSCADHCVAIVHTGTYKSVMLSHNSINNVHFQFFKREFCEAGRDRFLNVMPPFFAYGLGYGIHLALAAGMTSILIPRLEPEKLAGLILKYRPQVIAGTPQHFKTLIKNRHMKHADLSCFKNICGGGDFISLHDEERINEFLRAHKAKEGLTKGYGLGEVSDVSAACMHEYNKPGSVGLPLPDVIIAAFDPDTGRELEMGEIGEICIYSPTAMIGYYGKPEETAYVLRTHADGRRWVHSGDLGYVDEDGFVFIMGRRKRLIIRHDAYRVFPSAIEDAMSFSEDVAVCSVVGAPDRIHGSGSVPHVFVCLADACMKGKEEVEMELRKLCRDKLPEYHQPEYFTFLESMPLTPTEKVDFRALEELARREAEEDEV